MPVPRVVALQRGCAVAGHGVEKGDAISDHAPTSMLSLFLGTPRFPFISLLTCGAHLILVPTNLGEMHGDRVSVATSLP